MAFLVGPGYEYVVTLWGIWRAGGVAVPIGVSLPDPEVEFILDDARPSVAVAGDDYSHRLEPLALSRAIPFVGYQSLLRSSQSALPRVRESDASLMMYTSGTTGRPKGVVHTHASIAAQIQSVMDIWGWSEDDRILLVLPLNHGHGIVNVLTSTLWAGATCEMLGSFDADTTWARIASGDITLFMAVPTIYARLIRSWERASKKDQATMSRGARSVRLMVCGSAPLPVELLGRWREITDHTLLERYGATETGIVLSNTLEDRAPGYVGRPVPGVEIRLVTEEGTPVATGENSEIQVRGSTLFREYWNRSDATESALADGWFRTEDIATAIDSRYRIPGRDSLDIIKTGGEKVSAIEIEDALRFHLDIIDAAVIGLPDQEMGTACMCGDHSEAASRSSSTRRPPGVVEATHVWIQGAKGRCNRR